MKRLLLLLALCLPLFAQQVPPQRNSYTLTQGQTALIPNTAGSQSVSFEYLYNTTPASASITIQGCMRGKDGTPGVAGTCDTAADTYTGTTNSIRSPSFTKVYDTFLITAGTLSAGTTLTVNTTVVVSKAGTSSGGGSGTISSGTTNQIPKYTAATTIGNSSLDDGGTTANTLTYSAGNIVASNGEVRAATSATAGVLRLGSDLNVFLSRASGTSFTVGGSVVFNNDISMSTSGRLIFNAVTITDTAPTIAAAGCGGAAATITAGSGTAAFAINVGTTPGSACTVTLPAASNTWVCTANDITTNSSSVFYQKQTGAVSTTSVTITNFNTSAAATSFVASDVVNVSCFGR